MTEEIFLAAVISIDIFMVSAAYCGSGIRIPFLSAAIIALSGAAALWLTTSLSVWISGAVPQEICSAAAFIVFSIMGVSTIFKSIIRTIVRTLSRKGDLSLKMGSQGLMVRLYLDDTAADTDNSKILSAAESAALAAASSLDCAAAGLSCGLSGINPLRTALFTLTAGFSAILLGGIAGNRISSLRTDLSWVGGVLLIVFAVFQLME